MILATNNPFYLNDPNSDTVLAKRDSLKIINRSFTLDIPSRLINLINNLISMYNVFLDLSVVNGLLVITLGIAIPGLIIIFIARSIVKNRINKQHERVGRLLFRVTASLLALLISLSYANEKVGYNKVVNSIEAEAALIASANLKLSMHRTALAEKVRKDLFQYVEFTIEDDWHKVVSNPYVSKMWGTIVRINVEVRALKEESQMQALLKSSIIDEVDLITKTLQIRIYSSYFHMPYLTYILGLGLLIVWCFFSVYSLDGISTFFITIYNIYIGVLLYFVIMLGNPLGGPLKIDPAPFKTLIEMGLQKVPY
jgi:cell division protein FtsB